MSADVDEAREALLAHAKRGYTVVDAGEYERDVLAFEAAIRAESLNRDRRLCGRIERAEAKLAALREAVAVTLAEPFDLDPLRKAYQDTIGTTGHLSLAATPAEGGEGRTEPDPFYWEHGSTGLLSLAATPAESDYLTRREQRRLACACGHPLIRHTEYGCIDCGTSEASTPQHNFTRKYAATPAEDERPTNAYLDALNHAGADE